MNDAEFARRVRDEIALWRRDGIIDDSQARALDARYPTEDGARGRSPVAAAIALLGAVLFGAGVIAFFASNWQFLPGWGKLALAIGALVGAQTAGFRLRYGGATYPGTGNALLFLGTPLFGATLFLVAQGYHVNADTPALLLLWALGVLPMALLLGSRTQFLTALILLGTTLGWESAFWLDTFNGLPRFLSVFVLYGVLLCGLAAVLARHPRWDGFAATTRFLGIVVAMGALVPLTFPGATDFEPYYAETRSLEPGGWLRMGGLVAATVGLGVAGYLRSERTRADRAQATAWGVLIAAACCLFVLPPLGLALPIACNLLLLGSILGAIWLGNALREPGVVNVAVLFFVIQAVSRYVDLFWETLPPEVFFLSTGALLLAGGMAIERGRRHLIRGMRSEEGGSQ